MDTLFMPSSSPQSKAPSPTPRSAHASPRAAHGRSGAQSARGAGKVVHGFGGTGVALEANDKLGRAVQLEPWLTPA